MHVDEGMAYATLLLVLQIALGDNDSLNFTPSHFNSRDLMKHEKTGAMSFFTSSSKTIKRSSSQRSSRQRTRARYTYMANRPTHTRGLGDSGNDVLLAARLRVPESLFPALEKWRLPYWICVYCNRRKFRTRKNFVLWRSRTFVRYKFSYLEGGVTYTGITCKAFVCY